jgi:hypothetical protein
MEAIETLGRVNAEGKITTDVPLKIRNKRVRIVLFIAEEENDISEKEWLASASANPVFQSWHDEAEDIYSFEDGKPLTDAEV